MMTVAVLVAALALGTGQETGSPGQSAPRDPAKVPVEKPKDEAPKPTGSRTYSDKGLGLAFEYPATWQYQKKDKDHPARFLIPIEGTTAKAELQIIDLEYRASPEAFQETQATMIGRLNQQLLRQWQIEVLGVPLLMTKLKSVGEDGERTTLVGLLYSSTPRKFNFRLTAPTESFDAVEYPWQGVLETLRTTSGTLPTAEGTEPPKTTPTPAKAVRTVIGPRLKNVTYKGSVVAPLAFGGTSGNVVLPDGWRAEPAGEGMLRLSHAKLSVPLTMRGYLSQADNGGDILKEAAKKNLTGFGKVDRRYDPVIETTKTGASAAAVLRVGSDTEGKPRTDFDMIVVQETLFVHISGTTASKNRVKEEMELIGDLMNRIRLTPPTTASQ